MKMNELNEECEYCDNPASHSIYFSFDPHTGERDEVYLCSNKECINRFYREYKNKLNRHDKRR